VSAPDDLWPLRLANTTDPLDRDCYVAAQRAGLTVDQAEECDAGTHGCPGCPWHRASANEEGGS
jgi:hypothetical protein